MLDIECSVRGSPETYVQKVRVAHKNNARLLEPGQHGQTAAFRVQHYAGRVAYTAADFLGRWRRAGFLYFFNFYSNGP